MSDTPQTDAAEFISGESNSGQAVVSSDFARDLERENAKLRRDNESLQRAYVRPDDLREQLETAKADNAKLSEALQTAITDAYDARSMMAAGEHVGARSTLWDSCKKMEAAIK